VNDQKIPVVAPFANSSDLFDYNNLIIVETESSVYSDRIVKEVGQVYQDQKIILLLTAQKPTLMPLKTDWKNRFQSLMSLLLTHLQTLN
jgi:hypothetical protein